MSPVPEMLFGSMPNDGGNFILSEEEALTMIAKYPESEKFIKAFLGAEEFINNKKRYCLWLVNASPAELRKIPPIMERIENVRKLRSESKRAATQRLAYTPTLFGEIRQPESGTYLLIPSTSSEKRRYVPIGFFDCNVISSNANLIVPHASLYHFGVLTSNVHNTWMRAVCGRLKSDYRYSASIVYNNFPWPHKAAKIASSQNNNKAAKIVSSQNNTKAAKIVSSQSKGEVRNFTSLIAKGEVGNFTSLIESTAQAILDARAKYPDCSLADLYDEAAMPPDLRRAHQENDRAVMQAFGFNTIAINDNEAPIVAELFKLYQALK